MDSHLAYNPGRRVNMTKKKESGMVKVEAELPERWVTMISTIQEWNDEPVDISGYIREGIRGILRADLETMNTDPLLTDYEKELDAKFEEEKKAKVHAAALAK
jgi:hypothetical protein